MSCTVALSNSPVFSPSGRVSSSLFCKTSSAAAPSAETIKNPSSTSPSSPLRILRLQKPHPSPSGLIVNSSDFSASGSPSPSILKRKRPARLDIPIVSMGFGNVPPTPSAAAGRDTDVVEVEGDGYVVYCKKGKREAMEDRFSAAINLQGDSKQACFGIFDGHGGAKAAEFAAENLQKNIMDEIDKRGDAEIEEAVKNGYLRTDDEFLKEDVWGGTCSVTALIRKGNLVISNAGDCRAVLSRKGIAEALTSDHRPSREDERDRIEALGGYVDCKHGVWRIHGSLSVSRGIGDQYLKQWVIAEPETRILSVKPELEFLILASDGLWDKVSNQEAVDLARPLCIDIEKPEPLSACRKLVDLSISRGSADDISVMLIQLEQFH
ncbi:probable protein phosphatase 2C 25 [Coffea eugenioides]|uniref:protein-serine/threonine phosphatase n=1 Tax=Coffea arabica TaxID=13443 RepID=A0A6P6UJ59_COFAR|nr:probable protein phosphatase 2C 25 [Coffea arabica]XP_027180087.1 probable protein phosphatase 2C 25 [Coffea eugenioides]